MSSSCIGCDDGDRRNDEVLIIDGERTHESIRDLYTRHSKCNPCGLLAFARWKLFERQLLQSYRNLIFRDVGVRACIYMVQGCGRTCMYTCSRDVHETVNEESGPEVAEFKHALACNVNLFIIN